MAHAHRLSDHEPAAKANDGTPASAAQIFLLIELVRPISELAELILARQAEQDAAAAPTPAKSKKGSVAAALDAIGSLDGDE